MRLEIVKVHLFKKEIKYIKSQKINGLQIFMLFAKELVE